MRNRVLTGIAILLASAALGLAQETGPTSQPADYVLTTPRPTQLKATTYVYQTVQTTIQESGGPISKVMTDLIDKMKAGQFMPSGAPIIIYKTLPKGMDEAVEMEVGMPAPDKAVPPEGFEVRVLEPTPCVTSLFQGPFSLLSQAYPRFFEEMVKNGQTPSGELREHILYFENDNSPNNVMMIEMGTAK